ncbi:DUF58 domain-containing protein [Nocardioides ultimimeridianus]
MAISGRVPLLLLLGVVAVVVRPTAGTVTLWTLVVVLFALVDLWLARSPRLVRLRRNEPGSVRLGDPATSRLLVTNGSRRRIRLQVRDAWQPTAGARENRHRLALAAGEERTLVTPLLPRRRGDLRAAGVTVRSWGPLGLAARQRTYDVPGSVRALPPFGARKHLPSRLARLRELDGRAAVRVRGAGTEFDSLREYVRGDDVRSIDWRASARSTHVVVRTWQPERDRRVVLVLDTGRTSAGRVGSGVDADTATAAAPRLDAAMDATLLLAALAARAGDRVDFVAGDRRVRSRERLAGARDIVARLQDAMAPLDPTLVEADWDALAGAVHGLGRHRALLCLLTPLEPSAIAEGLLPVLPTLLRHHHVVIASVRDPELTRLSSLASGSAAGAVTAESVYDAAAASQELEARERVAAALRGLGVDIVEADAERLPPALADHYLALKAAGRL